MNTTNTTTFLTPDAKSFEADVLQRKGSVLVDFWAPWCGPCLGFKPVVEAVATERASPEFRVAFVDVDENPELAQRFEIRSIPALKLFRDGKLVAELQGGQSKQDLETWLETNGV